MIRRPPRSTLFPYRRSSDLEGALGASLRARLDEPERAADLADLRALVVAADEELELRRRGALRHRDSTSRPVASRPQRVASATWWVDRLSRSMKTWTRAWKNAAAARGFVSVRRCRPTRSRASSVASASAWTVAERGEPSRRLISPKKSAGRT